MGVVPHERVASVLMGKVEKNRRIVRGGGWVAPPPTMGNPADRIHN